MTILFAMLLAILAYVMKGVCLLFPSQTSSTRWRFLISPYPSPNLAGQSLPVTAWRGVFIKGMVMGCLAAAWFRLYWSVVVLPDVPLVARSYLAAPFIWLVGYPLALLPTLLWLPSGEILPPLHQAPPLSRSLPDFWGRRWNRYFGAWFRFVVFNRMWRRGGLATVIVFFLSGLMHEFVINLPFYWLTGRMFFGSMMVYFLLQPLGMFVDRLWLRPFPVARIVLTWTFVLGPIPLLAHEGLLRVFHLWE